MRNISTKVNNTAPAASGRLSDNEFNSDQDELENSVTTTGIDLEVIDPSSASDTNLFMLAEAMCRAASGGVGYVDSGSANAYVLTTPGSFKTPKALFNLMWANWTPGNSNTGPSTANVASIGAKPIVLYSGAALAGGELAAGVPAQMFYHPTIVVGGAWILPPWANALFGSNKFLTAPRRLYVNASSGSDSNDGLTTGTAFATLQKAANTVILYNLNGYGVTIYVADGTYAPVLCRPLNGSGSVAWIGNSATPSNCLVVSGAGQGAAIGAGGAGAAYSFDGFKVTSAGPLDNLNSGRGLAVNQGATISASNFEFGACANCHVLGADPGSSILLSNKVIISGATSFHMYAAGGVIRLDPKAPVALTISTAVAITYFAQATDLGQIFGNYASITNPGNVTGTKYTASLNGIIDTGTANTSYFPGGTAGGTATGGQYA